VAGTAPIEVSSGNHKIFRLSRRGNRRLNHAIHMVVVTQVRFRHSEGRAYYDRKTKEGKTHKEALRCLKRRISDALFAHPDAHEGAGTGGEEIPKSLLTTKRSRYGANLRHVVSSRVVRRLDDRWRFQLCGRADGHRRPRR